MRIRIECEQEDFDFGLTGERTAVELDGDGTLDHWRKAVESAMIAAGYVRESIDDLFEPNEVTAAFLDEESSLSHQAAVDFFAGRQWTPEQQAASILSARAPTMYKDFEPLSASMMAPSELRKGELGTIPQFVFYTRPEDAELEIAERVRASEFGARAYGSPNWPSRVWPELSLYREAGVVHGMSTRPVHVSHVTDE